MSPRAPREGRARSGAQRRGLTGSGASSEAAAPSGPARGQWRPAAPALGAARGGEGHALLRRCRPGTFWGRAEESRVGLGVGVGTRTWAAVPVACVSSPGEMMARCLGAEARQEGFYFAR